MMTRPLHAIVCAVALAGFGCGGNDSGDAGAGGGASGPVVKPKAEVCDVDPLKTGLTAEQTGVSADFADCSILKWTAYYKEPDPMIVKAMIYGESRFDYAADGCTNLPCGVPDGWSDEEAHCFGLMQIVMACSPIKGVGFQANGRPDLELSAAASDFANSAFNPDVNVHIGVAGFANNRAQVEKQYPGCTEDQYTLMALGDLSSYGSTTGCTQYITDYINYILPGYYTYAKAAGYPPHDYGPAN
jgi:hypothetical protein